MPFTHWEDRYAVGIRLIDQQHRKLLQLLNDLVEIQSSGGEKEDVERVILALIRYTDVHFLSEERLMRMHRYPGNAFHRREHETLTQCVMNFQKEFIAGNASVPRNLTVFLQDWLERHILHTDMELGPYLNTMGVR
jgi:hemerythrin